MLACQRHGSDELHAGGVSEADGDRRTAAAAPHLRRVGVGHACETCAHAQPSLTNICWSFAEVQTSSMAWERESAGCETEGLRMMVTAKGLNMLCGESGFRKILWLSDSTAF